MPGKEDHSFAARVGLGKVFEAVIDCQSRDILSGVSREAAKFGKLPSEMAIELPQNSFFFFFVFLGKCNAQITQANTPQPRMQQIERKTEGNTDGARQ